MPNQNEKPSPKEQADRVVQVGLESLRRYAGKPELLLKEHPELDFRNLPNER